MRVCFDTFLEALGSDVTGGVDDRQPCPLCHNVPSSLHILDPGGICHFYCTACAFEGDSVQLVAKARQLEFGQALELFSPGHELSQTFADDCPECHQQEYINRRESQALIRDYVRRTHQALRGTDGRICLGQLKSRDYRIIQDAVPTHFGCLTQQALPYMLRRLDEAKYQNEPYLTYAYTYAGDVTGLVVEPLLRPEEREYIRLGDGGVYAPDQRSLGEPVLYVAQSERVATAMFSLMRHYTGAPFPVACVQALPLPFQYRNLREIYLLNTSQSPLTLDRAVTYLAAPNIVTGLAYRPDIRVIETRILPDVAALPRLKEAAHALPTWIAGQLMALYARDKLAGVSKVLSQLPPIGQYVAPVVTSLRRRKAPDELIAALTEPQGYHGDCAVLANGYVVYRSDDGFIGAKTRGETPTYPLANVRMRTTEIIRDRNNTLHFRMTIKAKDASEIVAVLTEQDFKTAQALHRAIAAAYAMRGQDVHIGIYEPRGFKWREIRPAFDDQPTVHTEIRKFGVSDALSLELPAVSICDHATRIVPQIKMLATVPGTPTYAGIQPFIQRADCTTAFAALWQAQTVEATVFSACIAHLCGCILLDLACKKRGQVTPIRHLILADPAEFVWEDVHNRMAELLSGAPNPVTWTGKGMWERYAPLGAMPLVCNLRSAAPANIQRILRTAQVPLIGTCTNTQAVRLSELSRVAFAALAHAPDTPMVPLTHRILATLRRALPEFLCFIMAKGWDVPYELLVDSPALAVTMHHYIGQLMGLQPHPMVNQLVTPDYVEYNANIIDRFFTSLQGVLRTDKAYTVMDGLPAHSAARTAAVYLTDEYAVVDTRLLSAINEYQKRGRAPMTVPGISAALRAAGYTVQQRTGRRAMSTFWHLHRPVWDERVDGLGVLKVIPYEPPAVPKLKLA